jgi:hypothetical protein
MSGAAAIASARRRRAEPIAIPVPSQTTPTSKPTTKSNVISDDNTPKLSMKPLEILQIHDTKIQAIENTIDDKIIELSKIVVHENLKFLIEEINTLKTANISLRDELSKSINERNSSVSVDSSHIVEQLNSLSNKHDDLTKLVVKSQQQTIQTYTDMLNMKDREVFLENRISELESMVGDGNRNEKSSMFDHGEGGVAEMLRNMMSSITENSEGHVLNIHENDCDDASELYDMNEINYPHHDLETMKLVETDIESNIETTSKNGLIDISDCEEEQVEVPVVEDAVVEDAVVEDAVVEDAVVEDAVVEDAVVEDAVVEDAVVAVSIGLSDSSKVVVSIDVSENVEPV